jgi:hypothetical protein
MKNWKSTSQPRLDKKLSKAPQNVDISSIPKPRSRQEMLNATNPVLRNLIKVRKDIEWPDLINQKQKINEFWEVLFKQLTEPYMSKEQKEQVYN